MKEEKEIMPINGIKPIDKKETCADRVWKDEVTKEVTEKIQE